MTAQSIKLFLAFHLMVSVYQGKGQNINDFLGELQPKVSFQKLYLHTDRAHYFEGDTLWFAAYLVGGRTHIPTLGWGNLYVDLISLEGQMVENQIFPLVNGFCFGGIPISEQTITEGSHFLRAYTDYLKNFGSDAFFQKPIQISTIKNSADPAYTFDTAAKPHKIDVSFLPEGGFILADKANCIAFKAVDETGKGIDITGKLYDDAGRPVKDFASAYKGAGKVYFYANRGRSYTAKIDGYPELDFPLGKIQETGAKIKLNSHGKEGLQMAIQSTGIIPELPYYLVCMSRGEAFYLEVNQKRLNTLIKMEVGQLRSGINRFVLLDNHLNPVSERLVFVKDAEIIDYKVQLNASSFAPRDQVQLGLSSPEVFKNETARVSISIVDEKYLSASGINQNIQSYLLLDSELRGNIESPADYFVNSKLLRSEQKLDLLMCVNGWRNYIWSNLDRYALKHEPQFGFTFSGQAKRAFGKKGLAKGKISLILYEKDSSILFFDQELDSKGKFEFQNIVIYDSVSVFAQARNKNDKHNIQFDMELPKTVAPPVNIAKQNFSQQVVGIPVSLYRKKYLDDATLKAFYPDRHMILLDEVVVKARKPEPKFRTGTIKKNNGPYALTPKQTAGTTDIIQYLANKVSGVISMDGGQSISLLNAASLGTGVTPEPLIYIDGGAALLVEQAKVYPVDIFETIELITPPASYFYRAPAGAVLLTTKSGKSLTQRDVPLLGGIVEKVKGFSTHLEFYSPKYTPKNVDSKAPDLRNTLYWNPNVEIVHGKATLSFFTCDNLSSYTILVEGISASGRICLAEGKFTVNEN